MTQYGGWTSAQTRLLTDCVVAGLSAAKAAKLVGRSLGSVKAKARTENLTFTARPGISPGPAEKTADDFKERDEAYVAKVLNANVYGFAPNTKILVEVRP